MYLLIGVILFILGIIMIISPKLFFTISESWKNDSGTEPSGLFIISTRFGGVLFTIVGIAGVIIQFVK